MQSNKLDLHQNTISEFHNDLMVYYDLAQRKQDTHRGELAESVTTLSIPELVLKKGQREDRTILRDREWGTKAKWRDYMLSKGYNKHNTKMNYMDHDTLPSELHDVLNTLPIKSEMATLSALM